MNYIIHYRMNSHTHSKIVDLENMASVIAKLLADGHAVTGVLENQRSSVVL